MRREGDQGPRDDREDPNGGRSQPIEEPRSAVTPRRIVIAVLAIVLLVFAVVNFDPVNVNFLVFDSDARLFTVIVVSAAFGFVIGYFVGRPSREDRRYLRRRERRRDDD
ncbi:MAG TPA: LapA family protein [Actinomycetota bacterium]|nr:LapA family protein [Actinomycetota bacterium]